MYETFEEYQVIVTSLDDNDDNLVVLSIWAESLESAMDCGEILSAVYLK